MESWLEFLSYWGRGIVEEGPTWTQHGLHIRSEIECESRIELLNRKLFKMYQNSNMNIMRLFRCCSSYENLCACRRAAISYCRWDEIAPEQKKKKTTISKHLIMLFSELSSNKNNKKQHSHSIIYICIYIIWWAIVAISSTRCLELTTTIQIVRCMYVIVMHMMENNCINFVFASFH